MPVAVTGAHGPIGESLAPLLIAAGSEVRAVTPRAGAAATLRAAGAKTAVARSDDADTLWAVMQDAHTLCLLSADPLAGDAETDEVNLDAVRIALEVGQRAGIRRVLMVSFPGARPGHPNPTLRALGDAEELVRATGLEHLVLRCAHLIDPGSPWLVLMSSMARRRPGLVIAPGTQRVAPVLASEAARVLAAADDRVRAVTGTQGLVGPDVVTADDLADLLAGSRRWRRHVTSVKELGAAATDVLARDCLADGPDAAAALGVALTPLRPALSGSRAG